MPDTHAHLTEADERQMLDAVDQWLTQKVEPVAMQLEHDHEYPRELVEDMTSRGLFGALIAPDADTDLQAITTRARRDGDRYMVNGAKTLISNAIEGTCVALLVKTDPAASSRYKGMSILITPIKRHPGAGAKLSGTANGRELEKLGYKGIDSSELIYTDYACDAALCLIGGKEGEGFSMATGGLEIGRINIAARSVGIARRAMREEVATEAMRIHGGYACFKEYPIKRNPV
jgi:alkylation response protein AidB-like acyl-CoA dehydrogenase